MPKRKSLPTWCDDTAAMAFRIMARHSGSWLQTAESLKLAADILRPAALQEHQQVLEESLTARRSPSGPRRQRAISLVKPPSLIGPFMLMAGFATENLLKAMIARKFPQRFQPGMLPWNGQRGHNLPLLAKDAGLDLNDEERDLLEQLRRYIVYGGRYPVPRSTEQCDEVASFHTGFFWQLDRLFARFKEELGRSMRKAIKTATPDDTLG